MTKQQLNERQIDKSNRTTVKRNHLFGKVVLLIGNDTAVLHTLIKQLAQKGADIALVCRDLPRETVRRAQETVESLGRRFLFIEGTKKQPDFASDLVDTVVSDLGNLDVFIDLSAKATNTPAKSGLPERRKSDWHFAQTVIKELAHV